MPENDPFSLSKALYDPALDDFKEESKEVVKLLKSKQQELEFEQTNKLFIEVKNLTKSIDSMRDHYLNKLIKLEESMDSLHKRLGLIELRMDQIRSKLNGRK